MKEVSAVRTGDIWVTRALLVAGVFIAGYLVGESNNQERVAPQIQQQQVAQAKG